MNFLRARSSSGKFRVFRPENPQGQGPEIGWGPRGWIGFSPCLRNFPCQKPKICQSHLDNSSQRDWEGWVFFLPDLPLWPSPEKFAKNCAKKAHISQHFCFCLALAGLRGKAVFGAKSIGKGQGKNLGKKGGSVDPCYVRCCSDLDVVAYGL